MVMWPLNLEAPAGPVRGPEIAGPSAGSPEAGCRASPGEPGVGSR